MEFEDSEAESFVRMGDVVVGLAERETCGADVCGGGGSVGILLDLVPETVEIGTCGSVVSHSVEGVGDPVGGNRDIGLQHVEGFKGGDHEIVLDHIVLLDTVFKENVVSSHRVPDVVLYK